MSNSTQVDNRHKHSEPARKSTQQTQNYPQLSRKFVARRISEGETGRLKEELKCQACGKGYKHVSSLAKHLWEHTPEWNVTSKLLISKHQQVQLLEAASILVSMNEEDSEEEGGDDDDDDNHDVDHQDNHTKQDHHTKQDDRDALSEHTVSTNDSSVEPKELSQEPSESAKRLRNRRMKETIADAIRSRDLENESAIDEKSEISVFSPETPKEIPILGGKPIAKHHRNRSRRASTFSSSYGSAGRLDSLALLASPLPENVLAKDVSHNPPPFRRRQNNSYQASADFGGMHRGNHDELDEDGLQDPQDHDNEGEIDHIDGHIDGHKESGGVFGELEV